MNKKQFNKASQAINDLVGLLETFGGIIYCFLCAVLVSFPLFALLHIIWFVSNFFAEPQDEKPSQEILEAEDKVLENGGAFATFLGFL